MKRLHLLLLVSVTIFATIFSGCASSGQGVKSDNSTDRANSVKVTNGNISLDDYLRRVPGVQVQGSGSNVKIVIQGVNTFLGSSDPLFYIDNTRVGRDYSQVQSIINMHDVESIKVVKGVEASAYGVEGANGVIIINTKGSSG
ncbi:TonB-dependent receptor plug domain-containing protein [Aliifodinibius sp. S!AR15-10]|uniref:TonB-dependent receptor plug domain-containing protein n=1 Tax=Aliifodinibius sp. S!AR15-10 TaxID=2950437 RepID=UPI00285575C4|nr:TonB-dependent receptor plug domain-containing protein [Aliifodinibius sp. S!AR15-10]MDR8392439.1 TonB-dependent receptor plug domain-containing protein [Aliifodinibius sp. S!AR15-10]